MRYIKYTLLSLLLIALVLEVGLRASKSYRTYSEIIGKRFTSYYGQKYDTWFQRNSPNGEFVLDHGEFQFLYRTNSLGFREREPVWLDSGNIRLTAFGDSFTDGVGADTDETWPKNIQRLLLQEHPGTEVLNFGISGADPFYNFVELRESVIELQPTHVIFVVNHTDLEDYIYRGGFERFRDNGTVVNKEGPWWLPLYGVSHLVRWGVHTIGGYNVHFVKRSKAEALEDEARDAIVDCLSRADSLCRVNDIKFMTVFMPMVGFTCFNKDLLETIMEKEFAGDYDFRNVDLSPYFRERFMEVEDCIGYGYFWPNDGHFTAAGYAIFAELIFNAIEAEYPDYWELPSGTAEADDN